MRRLVLKELADNGLDTGAIVTVGEIADPERLGYFIDDRGPGLDPDEVAELFSIGRPLMSTKLLRLPTRGALGNGLRVVAGAVLASDGLLIVTTRDVRLELRPETIRAGDRSSACQYCSALDRFLAVTARSQG